ncbi:uncharacterized protein AB675_10797 [Cyphellophora attinorum]|uniref:Uncharacterized protein n=1 Tax=Cyphellophora attinorum TaxID=1664694 RepID=A0A0N0NMR1_9EURO|nr:uncharacterized protein AB675_10797 [Phialophora attinorum]KPI40751.1 hypothetical protein AB675_10797 [Phialophora attinorum]
MASLSNAARLSWSNLELIAQPTLPDLLKGFLYCKLAADIEVPEHTPSRKRYWLSEAAKILDLLKERNDPAQIIEQLTTLLEGATAVVQAWEKESPEGRLAAAAEQEQLLEDHEAVGTKEESEEVEMDSTTRSRILASKSMEAQANTPDK